MQLAASVNIHAAKTQLSRLVEQASSGQEIIIANAGKPVARLVPLAPQPQPRTLGQFAGMFTLPDGFDDPIDDLFEAALEP